MRVVFWLFSTSLIWYEMGQRQSNGIYQMSKFSSFVFNIIRKWLICLERARARAHTHTLLVDMRNFGIVFYSIHMSLLVGSDVEIHVNAECRCCNMFKLSCIVEVNPFYCYSTLSIELRACIHSLIHTHSHVLA